MKNHELNIGQVRQGDVLLVCTVDQPAGDAVPIDGNRVVLREGKATGHAHAFYEPERVALTQTGKKERHLRVVKTALLMHEEHTHAKIEPGIYDLPVQTEWTDEQEPRVVAD